MNKIKILIYGAGSFSSKFVDECFDNKKAEILAVVESIKSKDKFKEFDVISVSEIKNYVYDLMIVISGYIDEIQENLKLYQIDQSKCVYTSDIHNWICDSKCISGFIEILNNDYVNNEIKVLIENKKNSSYSITETYDGLTFIGNYADDIIGAMVDTGRVYSYDEIDAFFSLADKFYDIEEKRGGTLLIADAI